MTKQPTSADLDGLLAQAGWVERFARALVREDSEDVAQDAWLAAIQHPPAPAASPRPWFAAVMRNIGRMRFRSAGRRRAREDAAASDATAGVPTPAELAHRMELQRRLATAVLALDEPQRSTVVLVFYEGLSPADVARRQAVPATTVRSRLRAALVTLRDRLDAEEGGQRGRWQLALAPLVTPKLVPVATVSAWPLAVAAIAVVATAGVVIAIAVRHDAARAETRGEVAAGPAIETRAPAIAMSSPARTSAPIAPAIARPEHPAVAAARVPPAFASAEKTLMMHVDECYDIAHRAGRDLAGIVHMTISLEPKDRGVDASVEIDTKHTTIADPDFLECIRENATAIEHGLEQSEHVDGPMTVQVAREMPPTAEGTELVTLATGGDDFPPCPEGAALAGTTGTRQWCALPDGTKHGPDWSWDAEGHVTARASYDHGATTMEMGRPERD